MHGPPSSSSAHIGLQEHKHDSSGEDEVDDAYCRMRYLCHFTLQKTLWYAWSLCAFPVKLAETYTWGVFIQYVRAVLYHDAVGAGAGLLLGITLSQVLFQSNTTAGLRCVGLCQDNHLCVCVVYPTDLYVCVCTALVDCGALLTSVWWRGWWVTCWWASACSGACCGA